MSEYQPDWNKAPKRARFWGRDADGQSWWYEEKPTPRGYGFSTDARWDRDTESCPNWRETLQERPQAPDRNDWSNAPDWAKARAWGTTGYEYWFETAELVTGHNGQSAVWLGPGRRQRVSDYRWRGDDWSDSLLPRPTDEPDEIRTIREELAALTERLAQLEEGE
jgi:hypothetical protein